MAATSACDAWAVGYYYNGTSDRQTLTLHWNGKAWTVKKSPNPGGSAHDNRLQAVAATSATNAWAVGDYYNGTTYRTLILHWNGKSWKVQPSPNPGGSLHYTELYGVTAISATNAWAVGYYHNGMNEQALILHWNGKAWKVKKSPNPGSLANFHELVAVAASSSRDAWAVGSYYDGTAQRTLIEHWNGKVWKVRQSPSATGQPVPVLSAVASVSSRDAWAVGHYQAGGVYQTLTLHWDGTAWKVKKTPNPGGSAQSNVLNGVAATSSSAAWAVGGYGNGTTFRTLIAHWNGTAWKVRQSPNRGGPTAYNELDGVGAVSSKDIWAAGLYSNASTDRTLIERWNGTIWKG